MDSPLTSNSKQHEQQIKKEEKGKKEKKQRNLR